MKTEIRKILADKTETLEDGRVVIVPDFSQLDDLVDDLNTLFSLHVVVKSLPTEQCVRDWWREGTGDEHFWKHETDWSNEQVFREIYQALTYFINRWQ
jgi:hypothetical protein